MRGLFTCVFVLHFSLMYAQILSDTSTITITKVWNQEPIGWTYPIDIHVPSGQPPVSGFPVLIALHGAGGNGQDMLLSYRDLLDCHIIVSPTGYQNGWDICDEGSDAPDIEMLIELIAILQTYGNIDPNRIRLLGYSNGSALTLRAFVELDISGLDTYVGIVSQLSVYQFHNNSFFAPSGLTQIDSSFCHYDSLQVPSTGKRVLSICNTNDPIIPYNGGLSSVGVDFLPAPVSAHIIAESQGYTGPILAPSAGIQLGNSDVYEFSYLNDQVVFLQGESGHSMDSTQEAYIVSFLDDCDPLSIKDEDNLPGQSQIEVYPNPTRELLHIRSNQFITGEYVIFSIDGVERQRGDFEQTATIKVGALPKGVFFIHIGKNILSFVKI